ncbi:MAG: hypothetical protein JW918_00240 [Anaerolineae bacterium]|nr:hypothetical protein [Anaerolineae bacterium]
MTEDKELLREALAHYRAWNEAEFADRVRHAGERTLEEKWRIFLDLFAFGKRIRPTPSEYAQRQEVETLQVYYDRLRRFEEKRLSRERST